MNKYSLLVLLIFYSFKTLAVNFSLASPAFDANGNIPIAFTCNGTNKIPPLVWYGVPENTRSLALVVDDPDSPAGTWTHAILFNIPPTSNTLDSTSMPEQALFALNSWGNAKYQGPCPPFGTHRYIFALYALDKVLYLTNGVQMRTVLDAFKGHIIASAVLAGLYRKELSETH